MSIEQELNERLKDAMRARDQQTLDVIRMVRSRIQEAKTAPGFKGPVDDALFRDVIAKYTKQLAKAVPEYEAQGDRAADMVAKLRFEIDYLQQFLPRKMDEQQTRELVRKVIAELGVTDPKRSGQVMGAVMKDRKDEVDAAIVQRVVKEELGG